MGDETTAGFESGLDLERPGMPIQRVEVVIDERGLVIDEAVACARDQFLGCALEHLGPRSRVLIVAKSDDIESRAFWSFVAPDHETAASMLRAAHLDAEHHAFELRNSAGPWLSQIDVLVGSDGVRRTHFRRAEFFSFIRIRDVWTSGDRLSIQLVGGPQVVLKSVKSRQDMYPQISYDEAVADLLKMRIREGIQRAAAATEIFHQDFEVARGARELRGWLKELRTQRSRTGDYRTAPGADIDLDSLFADCALDAQTRAGAAIALRVRDGEEAAERLRVAAAATASPALSDAFAKIADGAMDDELEERLEKLR